MGTYDPYADRKRLTFEQAEGVEPLPMQLRPKEISQELSALLWAMVYDSIRKDLQSSVFLGRSWNQILFDYHVYRDHQPADEYANDVGRAIQKVKGLMISRNYVLIFGFLQFVLRHQGLPYNFQERLELTLKNRRCGVQNIRWRHDSPNRF